MFSCNFLGSRLRRIVHHRRGGAVVDIGYDLIPEREESILMGFLILVNVDRRNFQGIVTFSSDLFVADALVVLLDVDHQHM